ncbi:MAG: hypothetical protein JRJ59_02095, partial [Deltaproteobacteria bacterium]|nr:hypothetical protein [Deltaproteobacteria bacterium]
MSLVVGLSPLVIWPGLRDFVALPQRLWLVFGLSLLAVWQGLAAWSGGPLQRPGPCLGLVYGLFFTWLALAGLTAPIPALALEAGLN